MCSLLLDENTSTHDLHTEVDVSLKSGEKTRYTSTHDLHTEVDTICHFQVSPSLKLQLTTSTRRSTKDMENVEYWKCTSTHDLHTEVDPCGSDGKLLL